MWIPEGTAVTVLEAPYVLHRQPPYFAPDPDSDTFWPGCTRAPPNAHRSSLPLPLPLPLI